jgi:ketosteroid isomerase-like protein
VEKTEETLEIRAAVIPYCHPCREVAVTEGATRAAVRKLYDAYERRDFERVAALIHDDVDWIIYSPLTIFPFAGHRRGRAAVLKVMADAGQLYELEIYKTDVEIVDGDRAAVIADIGILQRETNRRLRFHVGNFLRFQDGKLIEFREFSNSFDVVEQALGREISL